MSQFGELDYIVDLETLLGYRLSQLDFSDITDRAIHYSWGDQSELIRWIKHKDNQASSGNFYTVSGDKLETGDKYPLIWMVTPVRGDNRQHTDAIKRFDRVTLIICTNTEQEWLNSTRWKKDIPMLQAIANNIIDKLRGQIRLRIVGGSKQYGFSNRPNFCASETVDGKLKALDRWDAVILDMDLLVDDTCKEKEYFDFCNN